MKCIVPKANLKVLGRAIHSLAKVGDEIYFEFKNDGLSVGTVNSSRCAYMNFVFKTTFFQTYSSLKHNENDDSEKCKIYTKSCLAVFKTLSSLERAVDKCVIVLDLERDRFIFQLHCVNGLMKTYNLTFIESEKLDAIYNIEEYPNYMIVQSKLFMEVVNNFQQNIEELNIQLFCNRVVVTNQVIQSDVSNALRTEVELLSEEFDELSINSEVQVIFCLKEFRALLYFCEGPELQFALHVKDPGEPIVFVVDSDQSFDACLILATVSPVTFNELSTSTTIPASISKKRVNKSTTAKSKGRTQGDEEFKTTKTTSFGHSGSRKVVGVTSICANNESQAIMDSTVNVVKGCKTGNDVVDQIKTQEMEQGLDLKSRSKEYGGLAFQSTSTVKRKAVDPKNYSEISTQNSNLAPRLKMAAIFSSVSDDEDSADGVSGVTKEETNNAQKECNNDSIVVVGEDEDDDDDVVPGTPPFEPPSKRFRTLFFGSSHPEESTTNQQTLQNDAIEYEVLAENSEDD